MKNTELKTTLDFIDDLKAAFHTTSDYSIAKILGVTKATISSYRNKKTFMSEEVAMRCGIFLNLDRSYILACIASERSKSTEAKAAWKHAAEVLGGIAAAVLVVVALPFLIPHETAPHLVSVVGLVAGGRADCILCQTAHPIAWALLILLLSCALLPRRHNA